ncbi:ATP-binding SpoIIE family protein phosphatase [Streptomyces sp. B6B3]|uniref:ATP-binding SpoIIE family protein phosphatase n=1 Tax=Streptomyces sp. B6B3 TaxID=3153570 RepID=UPI00325EED18
MRREEVLAACRVGLWRWHGGDGLVRLDAVEAELLGLPAEPAALTEPELRARFHLADYVAAQRHLATSAAEGRLGEAELRVVAEDGTVLHSLRSRAYAPESERTGGPAAPGGLVGVFLEVPALGHPAASALEQAEDERRVREAFLLDAGQALSEAHTGREVLRVVAALSMPGFHPAATGVFSLEGDRLRMIEYRTRGTRPERDRETEETIRRALPRPQHINSRNPAAEALRTGRPRYFSTPDELRDSYPEIWRTIASLDRESWAYLPLVVSGRTIGVWLVAFDKAMAFTFEERTLLAALARLIAQALARAFLHDTERELSDDLQRAMRPAPTPSIPGMRVAARYVPTGRGLRVGGDWYDVIPLPSGRVALIIGDVQGHDVRAAAIMAQLRIALRAYASEGHRPDAVLARASRFLAALAPTPESGGDPEDRFATCLYVEVDPSTGTLDVARAGHPDPAMVLQDGTMLIRPTAGGLPLGVAPDGDYPTTRLLLEPGETLLLCTDGLLETGHVDLDNGWARLRTAIQGMDDERLADPEEMAETLVHTAQHAERAGQDLDDMALLLLRHPQPEGREAARRPVRRVVQTIAQSEPDHVAAARRQLAEMLHDWHDPDRVFGATLLLSETVTNVLTHTDGDALLVAELAGPPGDRLLRVEVADPSGSLPHRRDPGELASSGRGLVLMDSLADAWGVAPRGEGKTTWFELRERPRPERRSDADPGEGPDVTFGSGW